MQQIRKGVSVEQLKQALDYDRDTGDLTWRFREPWMFKGKSPEVTCKKWNSRFGGKPAMNSLSSRGYRVGGFNYRIFQAHQVVFALHNGYWADYIDHENGNPLDNNPNNLRDATNLDNARNRRKRSDNTSGCMGVVWLKSRGRWQARIVVEGKRVHLGEFKTCKLAVLARKKAELKYGFHENHGRE
jgi:hypothetical protein